jgi:hypothetical protein
MALIISSGFIIQYIRNPKLGGFGQKVWWNDSRLLHSLMYLLIYYNLYKNNKKSVMSLLLLDVLLGINNYINHHYIN